MNRQEAEARGRRGERIAAWWLRLKGWRILDKRVRTPVGEIDLIARRGKQVAFVEVKTRRTIEEAELFLDEYQLRRVAAAADALSHDYVAQGYDVRIDAVLWAPGSRPYHMENVWQGW
ncbi:YraN family protein [Sphingomicrobium sediminis]|uniref:UPF0102 protein NDO55_05050 n=1 Tax=Sphingomicrobium sediminis TaxID=2950949 RepID=A0A9X2J2M8_9SPHN|nr:YraN family protein [Sphingomicrobium sediminis]MCM8557185.1 YraN family protein [Sphingomicrobium sediminis]